MLPVALGRYNAMLKNRLLNCYTLPMLNYPTAIAPPCAVASLHGVW